MTHTAVMCSHEVSAKSAQPWNAPRQAAQAHPKMLLWRCCREVGHHTYVTPTSYLELIYTYKQLLEAQQSAVDQLRKRYEVGGHRGAFGCVCVKKTASNKASRACHPSHAYAE